MLAVIALKQNRIKQIFNALQMLRQSVGQFAGFILSGALATSVHYFILIALVEVWQFNPILASGFGFLAGAITGFNLNRKFVFASPIAGKMALVKYIIMASIGAGMNLTLLWIFNKLLNMHYLVAQILATISIVAANFVCCKLWIFNKDN